MAAMGDKARFLSGSTMRHVVVMTLTGSLGLVFMFLVDVTTLFWVSWLGDEGLVAALGFGWTIQFFHHFHRHWIDDRKHGAGVQIHRPR